MKLFPQFAWPVPVAFADALATFRFTEGDVFHDDSRAYSGSWSDALHYLSHSLQVTFPKSSSAVGQDTSIDDSLLTQNWGKTVQLTLVDHKAQKQTHNVSTTQGRVYTALYTGNLKSLSMEVPCPVPLFLGALKKHIDDTLADHFQTIRNVTDEFVFVWHFDPTNQAILEKERGMLKELTKLGAVRVYDASPQELGIENAEQMLPTISVRGYGISGTQEESLREALKKALYKPDPDAKRPKFRLTAHGSLSKRRT
jgi:hypothetical protein